MKSGAHLIFDKYELVRRLAIGGMGEVFVARQLSDVSGFERRVILKSLLPDLVNEPGFVEQFLDEARVAATLNHPNVVSVFEVGASRGTYYIAMEFIPGVNLSQLRREAQTKNKPLNPYHVARIIAEAAAGLHHAHSARDINGQPLNLVHRDISPHNIMVRDDGLTKVVDFGIASAANRVTRTRTGTIKGKLAYMAPEQVSGEPLDGRCDQFALGIVFWELLTHGRLFQGDNDIKTAAAVLNAPIAPPSDSGAPRALDAVVLRMLERDASRRFETCAEVEKCLDDWLRAQPVPSDHASIAEYLRSVGGSEFDEQSLSTPDDFVLKLRSEGHPPRGPTVVITAEGFETKTTSPSAFKRWRLPGAVLTLLAAGGSAAVLWPRPAPVAIAAVVPVAPQPPPPPPIVDSGAAPAPVLAKLSVSSVPTGARVKLDGEWLGACPLTVPISPGQPHRLRLEVQGYKAAELQVPAVEAGALRELTVPLTRIAGVEKARSGPAWLSVRTQPAANVVLDGKPIGSGTLFKYPTTSGEHQLELKVLGGRTTTMSVVLEPDETRKLDLKLEP